MHMYVTNACSATPVCPGHARFTMRALQEAQVPPVMSMPLNSWDASDTSVIWSRFLHGWWPFVWDFQMFQLLIVWKSGGILPKAVELAGWRCLLHV